METKWVYIRCENEPLWTVGFYAPNGKWHTDSDHNVREEAAQRTAWLNGSIIGGATKAGTMFGTSWEQQPIENGI